MINATFELATNLAINAMIKAQNKATAELDSARAESAPAPKTESKVRAKGSKGDSAPAAKRGGQGADASGFSRYHPVSREINGTPVVFGAAGMDHEYEKMRRGLEALRLAVFDEAQEHGANANAAERCAAEAKAEGDNELALACAEEAVTERGLFAVKLDLARQIQAEIDADDRDAMIRRYRASGAREVVTETVIAVEVGSLASAMVNEAGEVVVTAGEAYTLPEASEATKRAMRCAQATGAHDSFNRIEGDNFAK